VRLADKNDIVRNTITKRTYVAAGADVLDGGTHLNFDTCATGETLVSCER
jgi:hypothetical protein